MKKGRESLMQFPRSHHRQMVDGTGWTSFEALHRLAAVAT
jgi:hypothetical protein